MKEVTKKQVESLLERGFIFNRQGGFVNRKGYEVGYYRTRHKRYMQDEYVDVAVEIEMQNRLAAKYEKKFGKLEDLKQKTFSF